ncbi:hypothetical protein pipiens_016595 [Culex pipiens pipiens]|uniref:Uncharacterized protein n=1 Tax=Culex pipiens pipiens TaxID=38569 RepID=A0ABD1CKY1_CULPP
MIVLLHAFAHIYLAGRQATKEKSNSLAHWQIFVIQFPVEWDGAHVHINAQDVVRKKLVEWWCSCKGKPNYFGVRWEAECIKSCTRHGNDSDALDDGDQGRI